MRPTTDLQRRVAPFEVVSDFQPSGDQPTAIAELARRIRAGEQDIVLLGATGTGKSATTAWLVEQVQRPDPRHGAQQDARRPARQRVPRAAAEQRGRVLRLLLRLLPARGLRPADRHLHREGLLDQRRGRAAAALAPPTPCSPGATSSSSPRCRASTAWARRRSTSTAWCALQVGDEIERDDLLRRFVQMQYTRNDLAFTRGTFRVRGDTVEIFPVYEELAVRIELFGDEIERLMTLHPLTGEVVHRGDGDLRLPGLALRRRPGADGAGDRRHRGRARGAAGASSRSRASCSRPSGCGCAPPTTSR